jgi:hypothetical protein
VLERVLIDEAIALLVQRAGHCGRSTGTRTISQPLDALVGKTRHPFPQGSIRQLERVGDGLHALSLDDSAYSLGTAEDARFFGLCHEGIEGGEGSLGKGQCEGSHAGGLHNKVLQKYNHPTLQHGLTLLSAHSLSDSNFPEAARDVPLSCSLLRCVVCFSP